MSRFYDVFISYNHDDQEDARQLNNLLENHFGLNTWFDEDKISAESSLLDSIDKGLSRSLCCIILIGKSGQGPWQENEIRSAITKKIKQKKFKVLTVLLPGSYKKPKLPSYLEDYKWFDLRKSFFGELNKLLLEIKNRGNFSSMVNKSKENSTEGLPIAYEADKSKMAELLIGESLYSEKDVCIRELIQNSVDACERRKHKEKSFYAKISVQINKKEGWFQVEDNGDGMNAYLLKNSFAVIGKSIADEEDVLEKMTSDDPNIRLKLISKFGIGFISSYIIGKKIDISTKFKKCDQINLTITDINEKFVYNEMSQCQRDSNRIGTTIRIHLKEKFKNIDIVSVIKKYVRHIPYLKISVDQKPVDYGSSSWNVEETLKKQEYEREYLYEMHCGISEDFESYFLASNWGFLISDAPFEILPYFTPKWLKGEIEFHPGVVDLHISREKVQDNTKAADIKSLLKKDFRNFFREIYNEVKGSINTGNKHIEALKEKMIDLLFVYFCCFQKLERNPKTFPETPILSSDETIEMILDLYHIETSDEKKSFSLREMIEHLKHGKRKMLYFYSESSNNTDLSYLIDIIKKKGYVVFKGSNRQVTFHQRFSMEVPDFVVLSLIAKKFGFVLKDISSINLESIAEIKVNLNSLPHSINSLLLPLIKNDIEIIKLDGADLSFKRNNKWYFNILHPGYHRIEELSNSSTHRDFVYHYLMGLFQKGIQNKKSQDT